MNQPVAHADDWGSRDILQFGTGFCADSSGSFTDDLDQSRQCQAKHRIGIGIGIGIEVARVRPAANCRACSAASIDDLVKSLDEEVRNVLLEGLSGLSGLAEVRSPAFALAWCKNGVGKPGEPLPGGPAVPWLTMARPGRGRFQRPSGRAHFAVWQTISFAPYPHTTRASPWCSRKLSFGP